MNLTPPRIASLVLTALLCTNTAWGMISDVKIAGKSDHELLGAFGFRGGGSVTVKLKGGLEAESYEGHLDCFACTPAEYSKLSAAAFQIDRHLLKAHCKAFAPGEAYYVIYTDLYRVYLAYDVNVSGSVRVTFLNPGNEHLSVGYEQLPAIYTIATISWACAFVGYAVLLCLKYLQHNSATTTAVHLMLLASAGVRLAAAAFAALSWAQTSAKGREPAWAVYAGALCKALFETLLFATVLALARGWCAMVPPRLEPQSACALAGLFLALLFSGTQVCDVAYVAILIIYFFLVSRTLAYCLRNMKTLFAFTSLLERHFPQDAPEGAATAHTREIVADKVSLFASLRVVCISTFTAFLLEKSAPSVVSYKFYWMEAAFFEILFGILFLVLTYVTSTKAHPRAFQGIDTEAFLGPAARLAAHPYETDLEPLTSVFVRSDFETLLERKRIAVVQVGIPGTNGYALAVKKHLLHPVSKKNNKKSSNSKNKSIIRIEKEEDSEKSESET